MKKHDAAPFSQILFWNLAFYNWLHESSYYYNRSSGCPPLVQTCNCNPLPLPPSFIQHELLLTSVFCPCPGPFPPSVISVPLRFHEGLSFSCGAMTLTIISQRCERQMKSRPCLGVRYINVLRRAPFQRGSVFPGEAAVGGSVCVSRFSSTVDCVLTSGLSLSAETEATV